MNKEAIAKYIYDNFFTREDGEKPAWVPKGNSHKQEEARQHAEAILKIVATNVITAHTIPSPPSQKWVIEKYDDYEGWNFYAVEEGPYYLIKEKYNIGEYMSPYRARRI